MPLYRALLICSDESCDAEIELIAPLAEIEALACDCGCGMQVLGWAEPLDLRPAPLK